MEQSFVSAATKRRSTGATNFNRASSRSHAILTISVQMDDPEADQSEYQMCICLDLTDASPAVIGKLNLVDLAGSENNKVCPDFMFYWRL